MLPFSSRFPRRVHLIAERATGRTPVPFLAYESLSPSRVYPALLWPSSCFLSNGASARSAYPTGLAKLTT
jgi:hypothetical protein